MFDGAGYKLSLLQTHPLNHKIQSSREVGTENFVVVVSPCQTVLLPGRQHTNNSADNPAHQSVRLLLSSLVKSDVFSPSLVKSDVFSMSLVKSDVFSMSLVKSDVFSPLGGRKPTLRNFQRPRKSQFALVKLCTARLIDLIGR